MRMPTWSNISLSRGACLNLCVGHQYKTTLCGKSVKSLHPEKKED